MIKGENATGGPELNGPRTKKTGDGAEKDEAGTNRGRCECKVERRVSFARRETRTLPIAAKEGSPKFFPGHQFLLNHVGSDEGGHQDSVTL